MVPLKVDIDNVDTPVSETVAPIATVTSDGSSVNESNGPLRSSVESVNLKLLNAIGLMRSFDLQLHQRLLSLHQMS